MILAFTLSRPADACGARMLTLGLSAKVGEIWYQRSSGQWTGYNSFTGEFVKSSYLRKTRAMLENSVVLAIRNARIWRIDA